MKAALAGNGYYEAPDPAKADMTIRIDYGIDRGRPETVAVSTPVYRTERAGTMVLVPTGGTGPDGQEIYKNVTVSEPDNLVYTGERTSTVKQTIYQKRLSLEARRTKAEAPGGAPDSVFIVDITSEGPNHDLRRRCPCWPRWRSSISVMRPTPGRPSR